MPVDGVAHIMHPAGDGRQFDLARRVPQLFEDVGRGLADVAHMTGAMLGVAHAVQVAVAGRNQHADGFILLDFL